MVFGNVRDAFYRRDPLRKKVPKNTNELVAKFSAAADGVTAEMLIGASMTMLLAALRKQRNRTKVEQTFDAIMGQAKQELLDHYDATTGKLKESFALLHPTTGKPINLS